MNSKRLKESGIRIFFVLASMAIYFPINRLAQGGINLESELDSYIPLIPIFVIPYLLAPFLWVGFIIYSNLKLDLSFANKIDLAFVLTGVISAAIYIFIPTFVTRTEIHSNDVFSNLIEWLYNNDNAYNAAPSGHTFNTMLFLLFSTKIKPKYSFIFLLVSVVIILSTVFTKQHNVFDIICGLIFALLIYFVADKVVFGRSTKRS